VICCTDHVCAVHPLAPKLLTHQESNARSIESVLESTRHSVGHGIKGVLHNCLTPFHKSASGVRSAEPPVMIDQQRGKEAGQVDDRIAKGASCQPVAVVDVEPVPEGKEDAVRAGG